MYHVCWWRRLSISIISVSLIAKTTLSTPTPFYSHMHECDKEYQIFLLSISIFYILSRHVIYDTFNIKPSFDKYLNSIKLDTFEEER